MVKNGCIVFMFQLVSHQFAYGLSVCAVFLSYLPVPVSLVFFSFAAFRCSWCRCLVY